MLIQRKTRLSYRKNWITVIQKIKFKCVTYSFALPFLVTLNWQFYNKNWPMPLDLSFDKSNNYINKRINFCHNLAFTQSPVWKKKKTKPTEFSLNKKMQHTHTTTPPIPNSSYLPIDIWGASRMFFKLSKGKKISFFRTHRNPTPCQETFLESLVKIAFFHFSINSCFSNFEKSFASHLHSNNSPSAGGSPNLFAHFKNTFLH